ncbi:Sporulation related domain-containing protein [Lutibacter oricola]|uniref:Sporulation related domain-containing protein n=1 Tax=Lutibacter oricola TaxID=762486 RepID=A0A1H3ELG2_9FLAO|nr:SPOR domain-containing protein [Lutibacter oricola]SDX78789.1 Sporulation related domain-containing protein [Lutibacter oricola]
MKILSNRLIVVLFCVTFLSISNLCAQSDKAKIDQLIKQKKEYNKKNKNSVIYKIQLYNGNESKAYSVKAKFESLFPTYKTDIIYKAPDWKTQVVHFKTKLEADRALLKIKEKFASAIVLKDKI